MSDKEALTIIVVGLLVLDVGVFTRVCYLVYAAVVLFTSRLHVLDDRAGWGFGGHDGL